MEWVLEPGHDKQRHLWVYWKPKWHLVLRQQRLGALGRIDRFAFDIEVLHLAERHGWTVLEVPVDLRTGERTTVRLVRDTLQLLRDLWRIRHWSATGAYELPVDSGVPARV